MEAIVTREAELHSLEHARGWREGTSEETRRLLEQTTDDEPTFLAARMRREKMLVVAISSCSQNFVNGEESEWSRER